MSIFRSFAVYLSIVGILVALALIRELDKPPPQLKHTAEPAINPYANTIAASGIIEAVDRNIAISAPLSGLVIGVYVKAWDYVEIGQPLFQIDDRELQAQLLVQEANIDVSEASVRRLKDQLTRLESVEDPRAISQEELKTRQHDVDVSEAQLAASNAQAQQTRLLINRLTVRAPRTGVILQSNIRVGEFISPGTSVPAMILGNLNRLQVRADIDEQNASDFDPESEATAFPKNNTTLSMPLHFESTEPYVIPKKSLTGASEERVDTRVLQALFSFEKPKDFRIYVGQQVDVFIQKADHSKKNDQAIKDNN